MRKEDEEKGGKQGEGMSWKGKRRVRKKVKQETNDHNM